MDQTTNILLFPLPSLVKDYSRFDETNFSLQTSEGIVTVLWGLLGTDFW